MAVQLINPNEIASYLTNNVNGSSPIEELHVFVELIVERKRRSVFTLKNSVIDVSSSGDDNTINLMGVDQNNISGVRHTTKWTDNYANDQETPFEGFGIENINIVMPAGFIPEITINFVDIRGLSFYNEGKKSPYSVLFDFPPPIYKLTIKGYYGKSLTYELHYVKHKTVFDSQTGNFNTQVNFIARTFAPLTDLPFKFIEIFGYMKEMEDGTEDLEETTEDGILRKPKNTRELIRRTKKLYDRLTKINNSSEESESIKTTSNNINDIGSVINRILSFPNRNSNGLIFSISTESNITVEPELRLFNTGSIQEYNNLIKSTSNSFIPENFRHRLYIGIESSNNGNPVNTDALNVLAKKTSILDIERANLLTSAKSLIIGVNDIGNVNNNNYIRRTETITNSNKEYVVLDITYFYLTLYKKLFSERNKLNEEKKILNDKINSVVIEKLGMYPNIREVFEIICNDVDLFFNMLRTTTVEAEQHHKEYESKFLTSDTIKETKIAAFPLYVDNSTRAYPHTLTERLNIPEQMPEVNLVERFIESFLDLRRKKELEDMRLQEDENGNNRWIPFSPIDTLLAYDENYASPYIPETINQTPNQVYNTLLERFYLMSQYAYGIDFYRPANSSEKMLDDLFDLDETSQLYSNEVIKFLAQSEAVNIANSLASNDTIDVLIRHSSEFKGDFNGFLGYLKEQKSEITNFDFGGNNTKDTIALNNGVPIKRNKKDNNFIGIKLLNTDINTRSGTYHDNENNNNPVDEFINDQDGYIDNILSFFGVTNISNFGTKFTEENIVYIGDVDGNDNYSTYYLASDFPSVVLDINTSKSLSLLNLWKKYLSGYSTKIISILNDDVNYDNLSRATLIVSNFGKSLSMMSNYRNISKLSRYPSLVEIPYFTILYMGALIEFNKNPDLQDKIKYFFHEDYFRNEDDDFLPIQDKTFSMFLEDAEKITHLSEKDKEQFLNMFLDFVDETEDGEVLGNEYIEIVYALNNMKNTVKDNTEDEFEEVLKTHSAGFLDILSGKRSILIYSQHSFSTIELNDEVENTNFLSFNYLSTIDSNNMDKAHSLFFNKFFNKLTIELNKKKKKNRDLESRYRSTLENNDIKNQLYYSFKNISDKWISGEGSKSIGFPLNNNLGDNLIDKFYFVDRAMNPLDIEGNSVMLNLEPLISMSTDYDLNVYTVISRLLAVNNFEIFPLQNFLPFKNGEWKNSFRIYETASEDDEAAFVCMYIGGTSSYLNIPSSDFPNDGIISLEEEGLPDFQTNIGENLGNVTGVQKLDYGTAKAFRVKFGEQYQSIFIDIETSGIDFDQTAESLAILSKLAADESKSTPITYGQNLFDVYENRAYQVKVTMMGNMMIQPTQYFQLENIPIYNGAYLITKVEHIIRDNHVLTVFTGIKILKYPNPIVKNPFITYTFQTDSSDIETTISNGSGEIPIQAQHNSMLTLTI